jgi:hypothetical protein
LCIIEPFNDPAILDIDDLYRRIPPKQIDDEGRVGLEAFEDLELSVNVAKLTTPQMTMDPVSHFSNFNRWRLASFLAGVPREEGQRVYMQPEENNPAHAIVWGEKSLRIQHKLASACQWVEWQTHID